MYHNLLIHTLFCLLTVFSSFSAKASQCQLSAPWKRLTDSFMPQTRVWVAEGDYAEVFESPFLPQSAALQDYLRSGLAQVDVDPEAHMKNAIRHMEHEGDSHTITPFYEGRMGATFPITCIEAIALDRHLQFSPYKQVNSEFMAYFLIKNGRYRLYVVSEDRSGLVTTPIWLMQKVSELSLQNNWRLVFHLHLHPFDFRSSPIESIISSVPIPSFLDFRSYRGAWYKRDYPIRPELYLVTNGFNTVYMTPQEMLSSPF